MFLALPPSPLLAPDVQGYWFVEDREGAYAGTPIRTTPHPGAVLSVNFGRPNAMEGGPTVPRVSLLGIQSVSRRWRSWSDTSFVMAMLTCVGLTRLFPGVGSACRDQLVELGALVGDGVTHGVADDLTAAWEPHRVARRLDRWLLRRLETVKAPPEFLRLTQAYALLRGGQPIQEVARTVEVTRRQLTRWFERHVGMPPKQVMGLERLQSSVRAVQSRRGDALLGYSDQARQIRSWRRRLDLTPGQYARGGSSPLATSFGRYGAQAPSYYL